MDSIVPAVFATGAECAKWPADLGLSVTSRLLDSLMKPLRAGRSVRLWINLDTPVPDHKMPLSRTIARALMRRRSQQLLSRLRRFRNFSGFSAVWTFKSDSHMLQPTHHPEISEVQRLLPHRVSINVGRNSQVVLTSHQQLLHPLQREAARNAMAVRRQQIASRACRSANCVSNAVIRYLAQQKVPETLVSDILRPSPEAAELLSVSAPLAAAATRVRVDPSGDVVITPVDQMQQGEDANLRKIVAQLHVNLGHPSKDAWARAIRLSGGSDEASQASIKVRCTVCERLTEPSPVPTASLRRWTEFGQCVALDLFMFADITGQKGLFLNMLDMASHYQVVFPVADKNPLTVTSLVGITRWVFLNVSVSIWEVSLNRPSVNWPSKLDVVSCQRPQCRRPRTLHVSAREERGSTAQDVWWISVYQVERSFDKPVALCSLELVDKHSNWRQWTPSKSVGFRSILASSFPAPVSCVAVGISSTTS